MTAAELLEDHAELWRQATRHPFLDGVREGTLPPTSFDRWLVQDQLFVEVLLRAQAGILASAPPADFGLLAGGSVALADELAWFESVASSRGLAMPGRPLPATDSYTTFVRRLPARPYAVAVTALWAVERAYLEAWRTAVGGSDEYRSFVEHWTAPAFAEYVAALEAASDRALAAATAAVRAKASAALAEVARHEAAFWAMAF